MLRDSYMLDANAVLRFLLQDLEEEFQEVRTVVKKNVGRDYKITVDLNMTYKQFCSEWSGDFLNATAVV